MTRTLFWSTSIGGHSQGGAAQGFESVVCQPAETERVDQMQWLSNSGTQRLGAILHGELAPLSGRSSNSAARTNSRCA